MNTIQSINDKNIPQQANNLLAISFNLKQCTVYHNKFGCYSIDLKYGNSNKRSPTINILKEKVNLDVIIDFKDVAFEGDEIIISLYNQMLVKNKQNDILISQQKLKLSQYKNVNKESDEFLTFEQDGQLKAQVKYILQVQNLTDEHYQQKRIFIDLIKQWMQNKFMKQIIKQVEIDEKRSADEEKLKKLKQQQEEQLKKKREEEELKKKKQEEEEYEKQRQEKFKKYQKQQELERLKQLQMEREQREKEKLKKEEEEKEKLKQQKLKQKEDRAKQRKKEQQEEEERIKMKLKAEENELKQYENEEFEDFEEQQKKKKNIPKLDINKSQVKEEIIEDNNRINSQFYIQPPTNRGQSRESSQDRSYLDKNGLKQRSAQKEKRDFMKLLKQWLNKFLRRIIRSTSFVDMLNQNTFSFYIFGDETFPYIIIFNPLSQQLDRISLPKSLTMYRYSQAVGLTNGKIFICGGVNSKLNNILPFCQLYDPFINKGYPMPSMHYARYTHSAIYYNDYVYAIGGRTYGNGELSILNSFERFSLKTNKWEKLAPLQDGRCTTTLIGLQDKRFLYLIGGFSPRGKLNQIERYNINENTWNILKIQLPVTVEAGIAFNTPGSSDNFYFMFGKGEQDRNEQIFKIQINPNQPEQDKITVVGKVKKSRVLPNYFVDENQKLFVFGSGDENAFEKFDIPSFESRYEKKTSVDILPQDMKMFCSALSFIEKPRKPALTGVKDAYYIHLVVLEEDLSVKQFKQAKEQITNVSNKIQLKRPIKNVSCQLVNSNYLLLFGGEYQQNITKTPSSNKSASSKQLQQSQLQQSEIQNIKLSKECYIFSLNSQQMLQLSPSLDAKKNSTIFLINQMVYSFGGEKIVNGKQEIVNQVERFHLKKNQWERMSNIPQPVSLSTIFQFDNSVYLVGGLNSSRLFNNIVYEYHLQYDYFINSNRKIPIEFKHTIQFVDSQKRNTQFVLFFSASFKQQVILNLQTGDYKKIDLIPAQYIDDEKRVLRVSQEKEVSSFILPNKIDIYRSNINFDLITEDGFPSFELKKEKEIILQNGKQVQNVSKDQVPPIRNIFMTRYVDRRMEFYDFIEFNENRNVLRTQSSSNGQNLNSTNNIDDNQQNGLQNFPIQNVSKNSVTCMFEDNEGQIRLIKQELATGYEEELPINVNNLGETKIYKKSSLQFISENSKILLSGGLEGNTSMSSIVEIDLGKKKVQQIQEMITSRYNHCQIIVNNYLYMIGGCNSAQNSSSSKNNSPQVSKLQQITNISKSQSGSVVMDKQLKLQKNQSAIIPEQLKSPNTSQKFDLPKKQTSQKSASNISTSISQNNFNKPSLSNQQFKSSIDNIMVDYEDEQIEENFNHIENGKDDNEEYFLSKATYNRKISNQSSLSKSSNRSNHQKQSNSVSFQRINNLQSRGNNRSQQSSIMILKKVDRLNLKTNEIEQVSDLHHQVMNASCCEIRGVIFVVGGKDSINTSVDFIQKYEIASNSWSIASFKLWEPLHSVSCISVGFNQIIVFGGVNSTEHIVKDIQVLDHKTGSTKKVAISSITNLPPLLFSHISQKSLVTKDVYLFDKKYIQCIDLVSNFDSYLVKEISPISAIEQLKDQKQIYGFFSSRLHDNSTLSTHSQYSSKLYDTFTIFGNEKNPIQLSYDMKLVRSKISQIPKTFQLLQYSGACYSEQDNSIILSGGMESDTISSFISFYKNYQFQQLQIQMLLPRFLHASVFYQNKIYFIGGKSYSASNKVSKQQTSVSPASTNSPNSSPTSQNSDDKSTKFACSSECEVHDLLTQQQSRIAQLNFPRSNIQAIVLMDYIYTFGGFGGDKRLRSIERFIPLDNKWEIVDCYLNFDLENYQLCKISPFEVLIVGGKENGQNSSKIFIFNAKYHTLTLSNIKLTYDFSAFKCAVYNDELYVFGCFQNQAMIISYNLKNGQEETKVPIQQLSQLEISWSSIQTKSY